MSRSIALIPLLACLATPALGARKDKVEVENVADAGLPTVPGPEVFQLGPGDAIAIKVWRQDDLTMDVVIAPDGTITYPLVGRLSVAGLTYPEVTEALTRAIATYYNDPQVSVNILSIQSRKVFVVGEVENPAVLQLTNPISIVEALAMAGGINPDAQTSNVLLVRGGLDTPKLYTVDVKSILTRGALDQNVTLQQGDIVVVPTRTITSAARFFADVRDILAPFVAASAIYRNALGGGAQGTSTVLE